MKPIFITEKQKEEILNNFKTQLTKLSKCPDGVINFKTNIQHTPVENTEKATILFKPMAYLKTMLYVRDTSTEIAWHGTVKRENTNTFLVTDVFLYPQKLSAATVTTDQEEYNKWTEELPDDVFNNMRLQGHSHVNFGASPSGTDRQYYDDILNVLPNNDYYIFMIINKSGATYFEIVDLANNIIYENKDIEMEVITEENEQLTKYITLDKEYYCAKPVYTFNSPANIYNTQLTACPGLANNYQTHDCYTPEQSELDYYLDELETKWRNPALSAPTKKKKKEKNNELK